MKNRIALLLAVLIVPSAATAQPYVTAKFAHSGADLALRSLYNGFIDDNSFGLGFDVGVGFGRRWHSKRCRTPRIRNLRRCGEAAGDAEGLQLGATPKG